MFAHYSICMQFYNLLLRFAILFIYRFKPQRWNSQRSQSGKKWRGGIGGVWDKAVTGKVVVEGTWRMGGHVFSGVPGVKSSKVPCEASRM
jgi:hypothetical protein